jgi:hypothetical protein
MSVKEAVIKEYLGTNCSMHYLRTKYGIRSTSTIHYWLKDREKDDGVPYLAQRNQLITMPKGTSGESFKVQELKRRIQQLERELEDAKLLAEAYSKMIKKAEEELKIPIRKKHNTK